MTISLEQIESKLSEGRMQVLNEFDDYVSKRRGEGSVNDPITWRMFANGYIDHINSMNGYYVSCSHAVNYSERFSAARYLMYLETWMYKETIYPILEDAMKEVIKEVK